MREWELLLCDACGRERVRPSTGAQIVVCPCGSETWALYDLVPVARDIEERYALINEGEQTDAPVTA